MIFMKSADGRLSIVVLETVNLEELKKGRPARTPDGSIVIAWTPDPVWLSDRIMDTDGDTKKIGELIDEAAKRPQKSARPYHRPHETPLGSSPEDRDDE